MSRHVAPALLAVALAAGCLPATPRSTVRLIDGEPQDSAFVSPGAYHHYIEGEIALLQGDSSVAAEHFQAALTYDPESAYIHFRLAEIHGRAGRLKEAHAELDGALRLRPGFADALVLRGKLYWLVGDAPRAGAALELCIAANPDQPAAYLVQAGVLEQTSRVAEARRVLEQLTKRVARDADGHAALAFLCLRQVDYGCAARHLGAVLQSRADLETLVRLAHVHRSEGHLQEAIKLLREAFDRSGGQLAVASTLAEVLLQAGETQAIDDLLSILESATDEGPERLVQLVELCVEAERPARGLALADGQAKQEDSAALQIARAEALAKLGRGQEAKQALRRLLEGPQGHAAAVRLARLLQREGALSEASDVLRQALTRHGHHDGVALALSLALSRQGKADPSVQVVRDALLGRPESRELRFGLGAALERVGRWREAIAVMRQLLAKNSKDASAHNFIGYTQVEHGVELKEAERSIRQALYHTPGEGYIMDSLGWLYFRQGRLTEAQRVLRVACRLAPREAEVLGHLAEVTAALKDLGGALQLLRRALALSDDPKLTARFRQRLNELEKGRVGTRW